MCVGVCVYLVTGDKENERRGEKGEVNLQKRTPKQGADKQAEKTMTRKGK